MAGLVPAIHVLQNLCVAAGFTYLLTNRPNGILYVGVTSAPIPKFANIRGHL
jgi:putative endonuclease